MSAEIHCPKCASTNVVFSKKRGAYFCEDCGHVLKLLKPTASDFASDARIRQLLVKKLVGRTWLFEAVENWRTGRACHSVRAEVESENDPAHSRRAEDCAPYHDGPSGTDSRLFWLMGAPGIGKSAFAAHLAHEYGRGTVIAVQFCDWKKPDHRDACRIIRTLAFQIATRLPDYRKLLLTLPIMTELDWKDAAELFDYLLANPLRSVINGGWERYLSFGQRYMVNLTSHPATRRRLGEPT